MSFTLFSKCDVGTGINTPVVANKNWGPGNYIASTTTDNDSIWNVVGTPSGSTKNRGILQRLAADTAGNWKGALLRFQWTDLEGDTLGSYTAGMDKVESYLSQMSSYPGRRLIIFIQIKTSGDPNGTNPPHAVPKYMRDSSSYYGDGANNYTNTSAGGVFTQGSQNGQYAYLSSNGGPGGFIPNMHNANVRDRFIALMDEFATRFNTNPYLEAICFSEASIAKPAGAPSNWNTLAGGGVAWFDNMLAGFVAARSSLSNVQICQWINADRSDMKTWVPELQAAGIGVGMPDLCSEDKGFNLRNDYVGQAGTAPGNIQHCQNGAGVAIVMGHASKPALSGTVANRSQTSGTQQGQAHVYPTYPGVGLSRQQTRDFAVTDANGPGVTHLLWAHNTGNQPATGDSDPLAPATADTFTAFTGYGGQGFNTLTDAWISNGSSTITTVETRPTGW